MTKSASDGLLNYEGMLGVLKAAVETAGSQAAWAAENGVSPAYLSDVLAGRRRPGKKILEALGYEQRVMYAKAK